MELTTPITAHLHHRDDEPEDGYWNYEIKLDVGENSVILPCWARCGWLTPGAHADLDGSGLSLWGDSQPGGWRVTSGDGQADGAPSATDDGDIDDDIPIRSGHEYSVVPLEWIPELDAAVRKFKDAIDDDESNDKWEDLKFDAENLRERVISAIGDALEKADDAVKFREPDSEIIFNRLDKIDGMEELEIRLGNYNGCGIMLAWRDGEKYRDAYWPDESDVRTAIKETREQLVADIMREIEYMAEHD